MPQARIAVGPISDSGRPKLLADALAERGKLTGIEVLSLAHLRRRLEQAEGGAVRLVLDKKAVAERRRRENGGYGGRIQWAGRRT